MRNKLITALLTGAMLVGTFASCNTVPDETVVPLGVTVASSDAEEYAVWLSDRFDGDIPHEIVVGIDSSDEYAVDMTDFEDDGYIIKKQGDATVIFGKTADGLDRGVRKYANLTDDGESTDNVVYHEGYRIEKFTLFGADISEYTVVYADDANENVKFAASELTRLIEKACGAKIPTVQGTSDAERQIIFRVADDESLRDEGYRYFEENGDLVIEGAVRRGCMNGVYRFLENECGWDHLTFGDSYLNECEHLDIGEGLSATETPAFDYVDDSGNDEGYCPQKYYFVTDRTEPTLVQNSYGYIREAHHGLSRYKWLGDGFDGSGATQPCFTNEDNLDVVYYNICDYLEREEAAGRLWGREIRFIDIAQGDSPSYCICPDCSAFYSKDGTYIGPIVDFANKLAEMLEPDYPDMKIQIFGYFETIKPPKTTRPSDAVYITYAPNGNCVKHPLGEGEKCTDKLFQNWNNVEYGGFLKEWCEMSDNVYVWYYSWGLYPKSYTMIDVFYKDMKWFYELGVKGIYINRWYFLHDSTYLTEYMLRDLNWDPDKTEEEFEEYLAELMEHVYGEGWEYVREAEKIQYEAQLNSDGCLDIWQYASMVPGENTVDHEYYAEHFDEIVALMDKAMERADSAKALHRCRMYAIGLIYMGCIGEYFAAYDAEDSERLAWLESQYARIHEFVAAEEFDPIEHPGMILPETLEELMWTVFYDHRDRYTAEGATQRQEPEWVTEMRAETATDVTEPAV